MKTQIKQWLFIVTGLVIIGGGVFFGKFQVVNAAVKEAQKFEDWTVVCNKDEQKKQLCFLSQQVSTTKDDKAQVIAVYQVGYFDKEKKLKMIQILPLGVNLQAGTSIISDKENLVAPGKYSLCTAVGCHAVAELSDKDLNTILSSATNMLGFMSEGKQVNLPISVKGLKDGIEALKK